MENNKKYVVILNNDFIEFNHNELTNCYVSSDIQLESFNDLESAKKFIDNYKFKNGLELYYSSIQRKEYYGEWIEVREAEYNQDTEEYEKADFPLYEKYSYEITETNCIPKMEKNE